MSSAFDRLVEAMCRAGWSDGRIAAALSCSANLIGRLRSDRGWPASTQKKPRSPAITPKMVEQINDLRMDNKSPEWIAAQFQIGRTTVFRHLRYEVKTAHIRCVSPMMRQRQQPKPLKVGGWRVMLIGNVSPTVFVF